MKFQYWISPYLGPTVWCVFHFCFNTYSEQQSCMLILQFYHAKESYIENSMDCISFVNLHKKTSWIIACTKYLIQTSTIQQKKKKKWRQTDSNGQHLPNSTGGMWRAELWGGGGEGTLVKNDGGENSFTAGWPQGNTFSTGVLSWKWERRVVTASYWVKTSSNTLRGLH